MNEVQGIPWGKVFSNFVWILGTAIILITFSYHEFLAHIHKIKKVETFKRGSFKESFILGLILVTVGTSASIHQIWLSVVFAVIAFLLIIWLIKFLKIRVGNKPENKD